MGDLCRSKKHPIGDRVPKPGGGAQCEGCSREIAAYKNLARPIVRDSWANPAIDAERRRWLENWVANVDATIARIRADEGFNGRWQRWQTLGEYLRPDTALREQIAAPEPSPLPERRPTRRCGNCGAPCRTGESCVFCATVLRIQVAS